MESSRLARGNLEWRAIVITCTSTRVKEALEKECKRLSSGGLLPKHEFLFVVDDPRPEIESDTVYPGNVYGVGSGGATINALLVAIERLSAYHNHTTVNSELVYNSRILVVHHGRSLVHSPGGSAFLHIDAEKSYVPLKLRVVPPTLLQNAIWTATEVGGNSQNGVWVISLDTFFPYSSTVQPPDTGGLNGALLCTVQTSLEHAQHHGVVLCGEGRSIDRLHYKLPVDQLSEIFKNQTATVISGLVYLSASLTEQLLGLHMVTPLDRCTYYGTDSGIPPLQVSLYFDLLAPLCSGVEEKEYLCGQCGANYARSANYNTSTEQESQVARLLIWRALQGLKAQYHNLDGVNHHYLGSDLAFKESVGSVLPSVCTKLPTGSIDLEHISRSAYNEGTVNAPEGQMIIVDSWIGKDLTLNCRASGSFSGFHLEHVKGSVNLPDDSIWQCYFQNESCYVIHYGMNDRVTRHFEEEDATIFNSKFTTFLERTRISEKDLWPHTEKQHRTVLNARVFSSKLPVVEQIEMLTLMGKAVTDNQRQQDWLLKLQDWKNLPRLSLFEISKKCDLLKVMNVRELIHLQTVKHVLHVTSDDVGGESLLPLFQYIASRDSRYVDEIILALHLELEYPRASTSRLLANIADLLGCMAAGKGGLRSGPAANPFWREALVLMKAGHQKRAMDQMVDICRRWISSGHPDDFIRAARHYERASQLIISREVETAQTNVKIPWELPELQQQVKLGEWVEACCPARIDLAGGWSDTPPICYEQGGAVMNIAIKVNGEKPIGTRVRFVPELHILCTLRSGSGRDLVLTWSELDHLRDYDNPVAQGALVKAVLLYCHTVDLSSEESLSSQLQKKYGGGIEIDVWSWLPKGSGLGGSSLLAGTIVAALAVLFGHPTPKHSHLIHATLVIEQWLTTGGGWQDQVGGLVGGAKLGISKKGTPLTVTSYKIPLSEDFVSTLNSHLLLLDTGKVRLARNLLQTVIRNWYARDHTVIKCFTRLPEVALSAAKAMLNGNLKDLGSCIDEYWSLKKQVASGCEPAKVSNLMSCLRVHCYGMSLAGAGGGGYLYALKAVSGPLPKHVDLGGLPCDTAEIDQHGIEIKRNGQVLPQVVEDELILTNETWNELSKVWSTTNSSR